MSDIAFPEYVETFIARTGHYLGFFDAKMEPDGENPDIQARFYKIEAGDGAVDLIIHRTERSMELPIGEYRCRMEAPVPPEFADACRGMEKVANRYATLGALQGSRVVSQCLISPDFQDTVSGILAAAIVHARRSIVNGVLRDIGQAGPPAVEFLSAWTDLDFEQIHYDYSHLGFGSLHNRNWQAHMMQGSLSLCAVHNNPHFGGGLLCLSTVSRERLYGTGDPVETDAMNLWEFIFSDAPLFGAWCSNDTNVTFVQFFPNFMRDLPQCTDLIIDWARRRMAFAPHLVELDRIANAPDEA